MRDNLPGQHLRVPSIQPVESHQADVGKVKPGSRKVRPVRDYQQYCQLWNFFDHRMQQFNRCRVRPVGILEKDQYWLLARKVREPAHQCGEGLTLSLLWAQLERWIASIHRDRQQCCEETYVIGQRLGWCEQFLQLLQPIARAIAAYATSLPF